MDSEPPPDETLVRILPNDSLAQQFSQKKFETDTIQTCLEQKTHIFFQNFLKTSPGWSLPCHHIVQIAIQPSDATPRVSAGISGGTAATLRHPTLFTVSHPASLERCLIQLRCHIGGPRGIVQRNYQLSMGEQCSLSLGSVVFPCYFLVCRFHIRSQQRTN